MGVHGDLLAEERSREPLAPKRKTSVAVICVNQTTPQRTILLLYKSEPSHVPPCSRMRSSMSCLVLPSCPPAFLLVDPAGAHQASTSIVLTSGTCTCHRREGSRRAQEVRRTRAHMNIKKLPDTTPHNRHDPARSENTEPCDSVRVKPCFSGRGRCEIHTRAGAKAIPPLRMFPHEKADRVSARRVAMYGVLTR